MRALLPVVFLLSLSGIALAGEGPRQLVEEPLFRMEWGVAEGGLGRIDPDESDGEAPASFVVAPWGDIYVLDQVQGRVAVFTEEGLLLRSIPLPGRTFVDIDFAPDGRLLLMDRLVRESLLLLEESTGASEEFTFAEFGIEEGGLVTAMLVYPDGVWLECGHRSSIRVLNERAMPGGLLRVPGRPTAGGASLVAARTDSRTMRIEFVGSGPAHESIAERPVARIVWIEAVESGAVWFLYHLLGPEDGEGETIEGILLDRDGATIAEFSAPHTFSPWHQFREFRVLPSGGLVRMVLLPDGVSFVRWRLP
jgi:hypothetical protein